MERFAFGGLLGHGAFGEVRSVVDRESGLELAAKSIERGDVERTRALVERLSKRPHRGLVRLDGVIDRHGPEARAWLLMERVRGVDLVTAIRGDLDAQPVEGARPTLPLAFGMRLQEGGLSAFRALPAARIDRVRRLFSSLADAISALHDRGFVHRDLKPSNVLVEADDRVVVIDVGLARAIDEAREEGDAVAGTAAYLPPEQASDRPIAPAIDVYAMGVLLFEAMTGALPFAGPADDLMLRKQTVSASSLSFVLGDAPEDLDALCVAMLRRAPELRPTARAIVDALTPRAT
ncbi:MAG: serine/threonine-protein kinase [Polyangiales bacterium]